VEAGPARVRLGLLAAAFAAGALLLYAPSLHGDFIGDDYGYIVNNTWIQGLDAAGALALLDPFGDAALFTANFAPVHLFATSLLWQAFGADPFGYHVVNVLLHAAVSALLALVFARAGVPAAAAAVLAAVFLVHPANVEAVAWAFQLKTILALGLSLGALLAFPRRPALALALFALGLLSKFSAVVALPVAAAQTWARGGGRREWAWLGAFAGVVALAAAPEFGAFERFGHAGALAPYAGAGEQARSIVAIAGRYLAMAATGLGTSANHEPAPARSFADPWFLLGALALVALGARTLAALRARREESAFWLWAAAGFAPISQIFPFLYGMADRYLYFILPGLLGGGFLAGRDALDALLRRRPASARAGLETAAGRAALAAGGVAVLALAALAVPRTRVWQSELHLAVDAAKHYPDGRAAHLLRARRAAAEGDAAAAVASLERLAGRGFDEFLLLERDAAFAPLADRPPFVAVRARIAENWIRQVEARERHLQPELRKLAHAHLARGDREGARRAYERALAKGGPLDGVVRDELAALDRGEAQ
jgi:hypothetical protein